MECKQLGRIAHTAFSDTLKRRGSVPVDWECADKDGWAAAAKAAVEASDAARVEKLADRLERTPAFVCACGAVCCDFGEEHYRRTTAQNIKRPEQPKYHTNYHTEDIVTIVLVIVFVLSIVFAVVVGRH